MPWDAGPHWTPAMAAELAGLLDATGVFMRPVARLRQAAADGAGPGRLRRLAAAAWAVTETLIRFSVTDAERLRIHRAVEALLTASKSPPAGVSE